MHTYYCVSGTWSPLTPVGSPELQLESTWILGKIGTMIWLCPHQKKKYLDSRWTPENHLESGGVQPNYVGQCKDLVSWLGRCFDARDPFKLYIYNSCPFSLGHLPFPPPLYFISFFIFILLRLRALGLTQSCAIRKEHWLEAHSSTMADFNFFGSHAAGSLITIYSVECDWTTWIGLDNDINLIPTEINLYKDHPDSDWANEQTFESGKYKDLEWAQEPDWFHIDTWWRGWIPIGGGVDFSPWYLNLDGLTPYIMISNCFAFTDATREEMRKDIRELQAGIDAIIENRIPHTALSGPPSYNDLVLDGMFPTLRDLRVETANAKRAALDRAGWICWWVKATPDSYFEAPDRVKDLLHIGLSDAYIYQGFVIDLCRDWQAINLPFWLYYNIPVFYTWGFDERNDA